MQGRPDEETVATTGDETFAFRELAYEHAGRLFGFLFLLQGVPDTAQELAIAAFRRVSDAFRKGNIIGDADEQLFRNGTRAALQRMQRSGEDRGYQPPTTSPDADIVAMGVISGFPPQQRAAIFLVAWAKLSYHLAGVATSLGEGRARDVVFAARQEYRAAQVEPTASTAACQDASPLISASRDEQLASVDAERMERHVADCQTCQETTALYQEFDERLRGLRIPDREEAVRSAALDVADASARASGGFLRRMVRLASGPALLVLVLFAFVFLFHDCGGTSIKTGSGRTSDVAYVQAGNSIVVVDTGSAREVGRVAAGAISSDGQTIYSTKAGCKGDQQTSTLSRSDAATLSTDIIGCIPGQATPVAVGEASHALYVVSADGSRLSAIDLATLATTGSVDAPSELGAFDPARTTTAPDRSAVFSTSVDTDSGAPQAVIVRTVLGAPPAVDGIATLSLATANQSGIQLLPETSTRVLAYEATGGRVSEVNTQTGELVRSIDLPGHTGSPAAGGPPPGHVAALAPGRDRLFVAAPDGGIVILDLTSSNVLDRLTPEKRYASLGVSTDGGVIYAIDAAGGFNEIELATGKTAVQRTGAGFAQVLQVNAGI